MKSFNEFNNLIEASYSKRLKDAAATIKKESSKFEKLIFDTAELLDDRDSIKPIPTASLDALAEFRSIIKSQSQDLIRLLLKWESLNEQEYVYMIYDGEKLLKHIGTDKSEAERTMKKMKGKDLHIRKLPFYKDGKAPRSKNKSHAQRIQDGDYGRLD